MERWHKSIFLHKTVQGFEFRLGKSKRFYWYNFKCRFTCLQQRNVFPADLISFRRASWRNWSAGRLPLSTLAPDLLALHLASEIFWLMSARVMSALVSLWSPPASSNHFIKLSFGLFFLTLLTFHLILFSTILLSYSFQCCFLTLSNLAIF
jgi:hypothetical protein